MLAVTWRTAYAKVPSRVEYGISSHGGTVRPIIGLGNHPKAAIDYHFKTGHRETA
jgi:DNA-binding HxlR family transcriptional regulator